MEHVVGRQMSAPAYETGRPGPVWEQGIAVVWFVVGISEVPFATPLRYLCALYFVCVFGWYYRQLVPEALRVWPILLTPIFGLLSFTWADYPSAALRGGIMQLLTFVIIIVLAQRLTLSQLLRCLMLAGIITTLFALTNEEPFNQGAQFPHKNPLSINMTLTAALCLWSVLDRNVPLWQRWFGALFVPITSYIVFNAESATGLVLLLISLTVIAVARFLWVDVSTIRNFRILLAIAVMASILMSALIVLGLPIQQLIDDFLAGLGKDASLTGRTELWEFAEIAAADRPWLGYGVGSFWQYDVGLAQTINAFAHKSPTDHIGFHNAFLEARVHIGYIGLGLMLFGVVWAISRVVREWIRHQNLEYSLAAVLMAVVLITAFTESWLWSQFNTQMHLFYLPAIAAFGASYRKYIGEALITETPSTVAGGRIELLAR